MSALLYGVKDILLKVMYLGINCFYNKIANFRKLSLASDTNTRKHTFMCIRGNGKIFASRVIHLRNVIFIW